MNAFGHEKQWTPLELIQWTSVHFEKKGIPNPRLDAEYLLADCLNCGRIDLYTQYNKPLEGSELDHFRSHVKRRSQREPLQYILGNTEFYGLPIKVTPDVLIPRPETELLVEEALKIVSGPESRVPSRDRITRDSGPACPEPSRRGTRDCILEIGTGSGCIAIALAKNISEARITATDLRDVVLSLARENAVINRVDHQIEFLEADLCPEGVFSLIVSNPPYISSAELDHLQEEVSHWEPRKALDGGSDGLEVYRRLVDGLGDHLMPGGFFIGEMGPDQKGKMQDLFNRQEWCEFVEVKNDLAGQPRIVIVKRR